MGRIPPSWGVRIEARSPRGRWYDVHPAADNARYDAHTARDQGATDQVYPLHGNRAMLSQYRWLETSSILRW